MSTKKIFLVILSLFLYSILNRKIFANSLEVSEASFETLKTAMEINKRGMENYSKRHLNQSIEGTIHDFILAPSDFAFGNYFDEEGNIIASELTKDLELWRGEFKKWLIKQGVYEIGNTKIINTSITLEEIHDEKGKNFLIPDIQTSLFEDNSIKSSAIISSNPLSVIDKISQDKFLPRKYKITQQRKEGNSLKTPRSEIQTSRIQLIYELEQAKGSFPFFLLSYHEPAAVFSKSTIIAPTQTLEESLEILYKNLNVFFPNQAELDSLTLDQLVPRNPQTSDDLSNINIPDATSQSKDLGNNFSMMGEISAESLYVGIDDKAEFSQDGGIQKLDQQLYLGFYETGLGKYVLSENSYLLANEELIGIDGEGIFIQHSGSNIIYNRIALGVRSGIGTYSFFGGITNARDIIVGESSKGIFEQFGGLSLAKFLLIGSNQNANGRYDLFDGKLYVTHETIIGVAQESLGSFLQHGGESFSEKLILGYEQFSRGIYELKNGYFSTNLSYIGEQGNGYFTQKNGRHNFNNIFLGYSTNAQGVYELNGGNLVSVYLNGDPDMHDAPLNQGVQFIGYEGQGMFIQKGGLNKSFAISLGNKKTSSGRYSLQNGIIQSTYEIVGLEGDGQFIQEKGINSTHRLYIGHQEFSQGVYELNGGLLDSDLNYVGFGGEGAFVQNGGVFKSDILRIANNSESGLGIYNLNNGLLDSEFLLVGTFGKGIMNQNGGGQEIEKLIVGFEESSKGIFTQKNGKNNIQQMFLGFKGDSYGIYNFEKGVSSIGALDVGLKGKGELNILNAEASIEISKRLSFGYNSVFSAVEHSAIYLSGSKVENFNTNSDDLLGLNQLDFIFVSGSNSLEVGSKNVDNIQEGLIGNFAFNSIILDGETWTKLILQDKVDNQLYWEGKEVLYVENIFIGKNSILELNGIDVYYKNLINDGELEPSGGGKLIKILDTTLGRGNDAQEVVMTLPQVVQPVPEPSVFFLSFIGGIVVLFWTKNKIWLPTNNL